MSLETARKVLQTELEALKRLLERFGGANGKALGGATLQGCHLGRPLFSGFSR